MTLPGNWTPGQSFTAAAEDAVELAVNNLEVEAGEVGSATAGMTAHAGAVQLDSFPGANDDAKLSAAMTYAAAQTYPPAIQFPARSITFSTTQTPYNGMRLIGPFGADGPFDQELGNLQNHVVNLNVGTGTSSWMSNSVNVSDVYVGNLNFTNGGVNGQFWASNPSTNGIYPGVFHNLAFYGFSSIFGSPTTACAMTQVSFTGHWEVLAFGNTAFNLQFSDCNFWTDAICNMSTSRTAPANGTPNIILNGGRTNIGFLYLTVSPGWNGINGFGGAQGGRITMNGGVLEGLVGTPATFPLINITGGDFQWYGGQIDYVNPAAGVNGVITQSGGNLALYSPRYARYSGASSTFPLVYQTGGHCMIVDGVAMQGGGETVQFRESGGTTVTAAAGAITYN